MKTHKATDNAKPLCGTILPVKKISYSWHEVTCQACVKKAKESK